MFKEDVANALHGLIGSSFGPVTIAAAEDLIEALDKQGYVIVPKMPMTTVEQLAIRCARGNNGGEWATHYTEEQKEFWRAFVVDLIAAARFL